MGTNGKKLTLRKLVERKNTKITTGVLPRSKWKPQYIIGYVHGGMVHEPFMKSILNCAWYDGRERKMLHSVVSHQGLYVDDNRNALVRLFLSQNAEWLLMVDTDIVFPANGPYMLLDAADWKERPIVSGVYFSRGLNANPDPLPVWYLPDPAHPERCDGFTPCYSFSDGLQPLAGAGAGFLLIHRSVFDKFRGKYPLETWLWFGRDTAEIDGRTIRLGEDLTFFKRCRELGIPIYGLGSCKLEHIKTRRETVASFAASPHVRIKEQYQEKILPASSIISQAS